MKYKGLYIYTAET